MFSGMYIFRGLLMTPPKKTFLLYFSGPSNYHKTLESQDPEFLEWFWQVREVEAKNAGPIQACLSH